MVRSKYRYIIIKIVPLRKNRNISDVIIKNSDIYKAVVSKVKKMHGDFGLAMIKTGFICKYCNEMTGVAILKIRHSAYIYISSVLIFITEISKEIVQLNTIRITATLHQAYIYLQPYKENPQELDLNIDKTQQDHEIYQEKQLEKIWNILEKNSRTDVREKFKNLNKINELLNK